MGHFSPKNGVEHSREETLHALRMQGGIELGSSSLERASFSGAPGLTRLDFLRVVGASLAGITLPPSTLFAAQNFFKFNLAGTHPAGLGVDPSVPTKVYRAVAAYLSRHLHQTGGKLSFVGPHDRFETSYEQKAEREAIDLARTITRDIWRERVILGRDPSAVPSEEEISASIWHYLSLHSRYQDVPVFMCVYACDNERGGRSFGTPAEIAAWNKANAAHGVPEVVLVREQGRFHKLIEGTAPTRNKGGDLLFACGFNGHGAPGGDGMSMHSDGSSSLSRLMPGPAIAESIGRHCERHAEEYLKQARGPNSSYILLFIDCCYSQDQLRNNAAGNSRRAGNDVLSRFEDLTKKFGVRFVIFTVSETMKPGFYQPGTVIPSFGPRVIARTIDKRKGDIRIKDLYGAIGSGGEGIGSNPCLFVTDRWAANDPRPRAKERPRGAIYQLE